MLDMVGVAHIGVGTAIIHGMTHGTARVGDGATGTVGTDLGVGIVGLGMVGIDLGVTIGGIVRDFMQDQLLAITILMDVAVGVR